MHYNGFNWQKTLNINWNIGKIVYFWVENGLVLNIFKKKSRQKLKVLALLKTRFAVLLARPLGESNKITICLGWRWFSPFKELMPKLRSCTNVTKTQLQATPILKVLPTQQHNIHSVTNFILFPIIFLSITRNLEQLWKSVQCNWDKSISAVIFNEKIFFRNNNSCCYNSEW